MGRHDTQTETPAQMKLRAERLRDCARRAVTVAKALGSYLEKPVGQANSNPPIWTGPYARTTTQHLTQRQITLRTMADDLLSDAARWQAEARRIDGDAAKAAAKKPAGSH